MFSHSYLQYLTYFGCYVKYFILTIDIDIDVDIHIDRKKIIKAFQFLGIPEKFGFPFFIWGVFRKLVHYSGVTGQRPPLVGDVANTYLLHLGPS